MKKIEHILYERIEKYLVGEIEMLEGTKKE